MSSFLHAGQAHPTQVHAQDARLLRLALQLDAVASGAMGAGLLLAAAPLSSWLGLPAPLLRGAGIVLIAFVAFLAWLLRRAQISRTQAWTVIVINSLWVIDSFALLGSGWIAPTTLGVAFVIAQAVAVLVFVELQYFGVKRLG